MQAEFQIASAYAQELSGIESIHQKDSQQTGEDNIYSSTISKLVKSVPVTGFEVVNQKVTSIEGRFTSFVQLKLPYSVFNSALKDHREYASDDKELLFDHLEHSLQLYQQEMLPSNK